MGMQTRERLIRGPPTPLAHFKKKLTQRQAIKELLLTWASLVAQTVKGLPAVRETLVRFLGWDDPLEKERATHSSTLAWKIPWTEEAGRLQSRGSQRVRHDSATSLSLSNAETPLVEQKLPITA